MMKNAKILLLDDEPLVQMVLCSRMEQVGALVIQARTCSEALGLARKMSFDAAVFDYSLPDGSGLDLVRTLRTEGYRLPVVILSGESVDISQEATEIDGIYAVLAKPPDPDEVIHVTTQAIGSIEQQSSGQVGRYAYFKVEPEQEVPSTCVRAEWLGLDVSALTDTDTQHPSVLECLRIKRRGTVVLGAEKGLRSRFDEVTDEIEYVSNVEELAALSRRPTSASERNAVLFSVSF